MRKADISISFWKEVINIYKSVLYFRKGRILGDLFQSLFFRLTFVIIQYPDCKNYIPCRKRVTILSTSYHNLS